MILVGEIRDDKTAGVSVQAALTGHLVLSTIHTNSSISIVTRLHERGIEPFLLASTLLGGVAQRLVRRIAWSAASGGADAPDAGKPAARGYPANRLYAGKGCVSCRQTGYKGRISLYEVLEVTPVMRSMISDGAKADDLMVEAQRSGLRTLYQDGLEKVAAGVVTMEEVKRVCMTL